METKSQLFTTLKNVTNELNQVTLIASPQVENMLESVNFSKIKLLNQQVTETIAVLEYLQKREITEGEVIIVDDILAETEAKKVTESIVNSTVAAESLQEEELQLNNEIIADEDKVHVSIESEQLREPISDDILQNTKSTQTPVDEQALADKFMNKGISDLNDAIGISEKFMFIHELFKGNTEEYISALNNLNNCENLNDATQAVESLSDKLSWNQETPAYEELNNIIARKYPA
ncbi:MAG: hypothetical protein ACJA0Q_000125 [Saprospiraceae bacterium]|jgi:hypothetical protein